MSAVAIRQQAFGRRATVLEAEAQDHAVHYFPHPDQTELFHDESPSEASREMRSAPERAAESAGDPRSFSPREIHAESGRNDRGAQDQNLRSESDQTFPAAAGAPTVGATGIAADGVPIDDIGTNEFIEICGDALHVSFGHLRSPAKQLARVANTNERTAKNWLEKKCAPGPIPLLRLMAHVPEFQGRMRQLAAMERDIDPDFQRSLAETVRWAQRMGLA